MYRLAKVNQLSKLLTCWSKISGTEDPASIAAADKLHKTIKKLSATMDPMEVSSAVEISKGKRN